MGGSTHLRHNEIRHTIAKFMDGVCHDVECEPLHQSFQGESFEKLITREDEGHLHFEAKGV